MTGYPITVVSCYTKAGVSCCVNLNLIGPNATPDFFIPKANIAGIEMTPDAGHAVSVHILRPVGSCRRVCRVLASCTADLLR